MWMEIVISEMILHHKIMVAEHGLTTSVKNAPSDSTLTQKKYAPKLMICVGPGLMKMVIVCLAMEDTNWMLGVVFQQMLVAMLAKIFYALYLKKAHV